MKGRHSGRIENKMLAEDQLRRVRKGARIMFKHMFGQLVVGRVDRKLGQHVAVTDEARNVHGIYLEDIVGVYSPEFVKKHPWKVK
jgi:hypothetical protein